MNQKRDASSRSVPFITDQLPLQSQPQRFDDLILDPGTHQRSQRRSVDQNSTHQRVSKLKLELLAEESKKKPVVGDDLKGISTGRKCFTGTSVPSGDDSETDGYHDILRSQPGEGRGERNFDPQQISQILPSSLQSLLGVSSSLTAPSQVTSSSTDSEGKHIRHYTQLDRLSDGDVSFSIFHAAARPTTYDNEAIHSSPSPLLSVSGSVQGGDTRRQREALKSFSGSEINNNVAANEESLVPNDFDILSGRGRRIQTHLGNILLHQVVDLHRDKYSNAPRAERRDIAETIVQALNANGNRFLSRVVDHGHHLPEGWRMISHIEAVEKVSHCFRSRRGRGGGA